MKGTQVWSLFWRRKWQPTPVFLPGKPHGQRRLADYSPWGSLKVGHNLVNEHEMFIYAEEQHKTWNPITTKDRVHVGHSVVSDSLWHMNCNPPGCSVHGILQARILEWVVIPSSGDLLNPGIKPRSPALQTDFFFFFTIWATREAH